jgi:hypothetical protein
MSKQVTETKASIKKRKDPPKDDDSKNSSKTKKQKKGKATCQHKFQIMFDGGENGVTVYVCTECQVQKNGMFNNKTARSHDYTHRVEELELEQDDGIPKRYCASCDCLDDTEEDGDCKRHDWLAQCTDCGEDFLGCISRRLVSKVAPGYIKYLEQELKAAAGISELCECKSRSTTFARGPPHSDTRCGTCLKQVRNNSSSNGSRITQIAKGTGSTSIVATDSSVITLL